MIRLLGLRWQIEGSGIQSSLSFPQAPNPGERVPCLGSAKPIACDATAGSDLDSAAGSGTMERQEDGQVHHRVAWLVSLVDQWCRPVWPGARWAGLPRLSLSAGAGPGAAQR